jgi:hypothetical protein
VVVDVEAVVDRRAVEGPGVDVVAGGDELAGELEEVVLRDGAVLRTCLL